MKLWGQPLKLGCSCSCSLWLVAAWQSAVICSFSGLDGYHKPMILQHIFLLKNDATGVLPALWGICVFQVKGGGFRLLGHEPMSFPLSLGGLSRLSVIISHAESGARQRLLHDLEDDFAHRFIAFHFRYSGIHIGNGIFTVNDWL